VFEMFRGAGSILLGGSMEDDGIEYEEEEEYEYEEEDLDPPPKKRRSSRNDSRQSRGNVSAVRDFRDNDNVSQLYPEIPGFKIASFKPDVVEDTTDIVNKLKDGAACIVNLEGVDKPNAQRIADFLAGASYTIESQIERINDAIFIIVPKGIEIDDNLKGESILNTIFPWKSFK